MKVETLLSMLKHCPPDAHVMFQVFKDEVVNRLDPESGMDLSVESLRVDVPGNGGKFVVLTQRSDPWLRLLDKRVDQ